MPKIKPSILEYIERCDRIPPREDVVERITEGCNVRAASYGFEAIATPAIEDSKPFVPLIKAGCFEERVPLILKMQNGGEVLLRPTGMLSIVRAYTSHQMNNLPHPLKFRFFGDSFFAAPNHKDIPISRAEWGLMMLGEEGSIGEAEIVQIIRAMLEEIGGIPRESILVTLNATGCTECRPAFRSALAAYLRSRAGRLCKQCKRQVKTRQTRIFSCTEEQCRAIASNAPQVLDTLCDSCKKHLRGVLEFFDEIGISYTLDTKFFRDGSWYHALVFELSVVEEFPAPAGETGSETAAVQGRVVCAEGGRVSRAADLMAGKHIDAVAGIVRLDALADFLIRRHAAAAEPEKPRVFLAQLGDLAKRKSMGILEALRTGGISVKESLGRDSVKSQLNVAARIGAEIALILGQKEALDGTIIIREIESGIQETVPQTKLIEFLKRKLTH